MSNLLGVFDYVVIAIMLCVSALIGLYFRFSGGRQKTTDEFLMGSRTMGIGPVAFSLMATCLSSVSVLGVPAETYLYGTQILLNMVGIPIGGFIAVYGFLPVFYDMKVSTAYEYLERRFGKTTRTIAASLFTLQMVLYMGVVLYAPSLALNAVTGLSTWASILSLAAVCMFYSSQGGLKAVLWTIVFQALLMYTAMIAVIVKISMMKGFRETFDISREGGRLIFFDFSGDLIKRYTFWNSILNGTVFFLSTFGTNQSQIQRFLSVGSLHKAQMALFVSIPLILLFTLLTVWDGIAVFALFHDCDPMKDENVKLSSADQLFPYAILKMFSNIPGLTGLCIAGVFSASLGTLSSAVNSLAGVTVEDFIKPYCSCKINDMWMTFVAKLLAVGYIGLTLLVTFLVANFRGVIEAANVIVGMVAGPTLGVYSLGMFSTTANEPGTLCGLLAGFTLYLWMGFGSYLTKAKVPTLSRSTSGCRNNSSMEFFKVTTSSTLLENVTQAIPLTDREKYIFPVYKWSYMWLTLIATIIVIIVGYISSYILSYLISVPDVKPENVSPFVRKLYFKSTTNAEKAKIENNEVELNEKTGNVNPSYTLTDDT
ncbi:Putative sodium-dependent multivitamin transporter [Araneus ventricosus]|uniref:Sodium-dependent multivitamin transporter n=1 Tax=Araneus ventricosus TaxID=182803 RepID=A0A4Y2IID6_ARAVE|nr:Putative sodium-dependent multivitamin transporter [Araneus ventricosus]